MRTFGALWFPLRGFCLYIIFYTYLGQIFSKLKEMELSAQAWSEQMFGDSCLGDKRRTRRLVDVAGRLASNIGQSLASCCRSDRAAVLGCYRFIENTKISADKIAEAAFTAVASEAGLAKNNISDRRHDNYTIFTLGVQ